MTQRPSSLLARATKRTGILLVTAATAALAVGLVSAGSTMIAARAVPIGIEHAAPPVPVRTTVLRLTDSYSIPRQFVGQVEPQQTLDIAFELGGTLNEVLADEGDLVSAGQLLARLDTRSLMADRAAQVAARDALRAQADLATLTADRQRALEAKGWTATQALDQARLTLSALDAQIAQAEAGIAGIDVRLDKAEIRAPFAGRIGARLADPGASVAGGAPVLHLLEDTAPQMRVGLPPELAATLAPGQGLMAEISGQTYQTTVAAVRADLDPATRTQPVILRIIPLAGHALPFGQSGTVTLNQDVVTTGAWAPLTALREGTRGLWTVMTYNDGTVGQEGVEVLQTQTDQVFLRGTFRDGAQIIAGGTHRVIPGQTVTLVAE